MMHFVKSLGKGLYGSFNLIGFTKPDSLLPCCGKLTPYKEHSDSALNSDSVHETLGTSCYNAATGSLSSFLEKCHCLIWWLGISLIWFLQGFVSRFIITSRICWRRRRMKERILVVHLKPIYVRRKGPLKVYWAQ